MPSLLRTSSTNPDFIQLVKHLDKELNEAPEAKTQIAFADVILLNKTDLVTTDELNRIESRIQRMNPLAKIHRTQRAQLDVTKIFNIKARDLTAPLSLPDLQDREENDDQARHEHHDDHPNHALHQGRIYHHRAGHRANEVWLASRGQRLVPLASSAVTGD